MCQQSGEMSQQVMKFLKRVRFDLNLHQVKNILHDDLMEWQKFQNGTLNMTWNILFDLWWKDANTDINNRYWFSCVILLLYLTCMVLHVVIFCHGMGFSRCDSVFSLAFPFLDNHGVMDFSCFGLAWLLDGFKAKWVDLQIDITHGLVTP